MIKNSPSISITIVFIYLNALVWLVFGVIVAFDAHPSLPKKPLLISGMAILAILIACIFLVLGIYITKRNRIAFILTVGLLMFTSLLTILDDFGLIDLCFLIINMIPLFLLIKDRAWFLQKNSPET